MLLFAIRSQRMQTIMQTQDITLQIHEMSKTHYVTVYIMPCLQAVVCVCDLELPQLKIYSRPRRVSQAGRIFVKLKGEKSCSNSAINLRSTCRIGDFGQFLPISGRTAACKRGTTACKQGITSKEEATHLGTIYSVLLCGRMY